MHRKGFYIKLGFPRTIDLTKFYILDRNTVAERCFFIGILIVYLGSLHPWFMWFMGELYVIPASGLIFLGYLLSNSTGNTYFKRDGYLSAIVSYFVLSYYIILTGRQNINAYITNVFSLAVFFVMLKANSDFLEKTTTWISKCMATLLVPSIFFFILYNMGLNLPGYHTQFLDYSYMNYFFFMVFDWQTPEFILSRFHSVFLEPGHLGSATCLLLMTQMGKWKKWWCIVLFIASILSFSLAAYALLLVLIFLNLWVQKKQVIMKVLFATSLVAMAALTATLYNKGDNMINTLILARLEIDDSTGQIVGNNRVSKDFEHEFDSFVLTSDVFFGRDMEKFPKGTGNSGYRVFIYQNGIVGLFLLVLFYFFSFRKYSDFRYIMTAVIISVLIFWIRGYPLWYSNFLPLLATALHRPADDANTSLI